MAKKFAAREVLVLVTEDDCSGRSNSENREGIDGAIRDYCGKTRFSTEGLEDVGAIMEEAGFLGFLRMNYRKKIS